MLTDVVLGLLAKIAGDHPHGCHTHQIPREQRGIHGCHIADLWLGYPAIIPMTVEKSTRPFTHLRGVTVMITTAWNQNCWILEPSVVSSTCYCHRLRSPRNTWHLRNNRPKLPETKKNILSFPTFAKQRWTDEGPQNKSRPNSSPINHY